MTIAAPCIWPILPIVLSAGATGGKRRPLGIVVGLVLSFTAVTLALASVVRVLPIDPESLRFFAVAVIGILGVSMLVPAIGSRLEAVASRLSSRFGGSKTRGEGFGGGFVAGLALGVVWSPCASLAGALRTWHEIVLHPVVTQEACVRLRRGVDAL